MPYVDIRIAANGALLAEQCAALQHRFTELMVEVMGKRQDVTAVSLAEFDRNRWAVAGRPLDEAQPPAAYVEIKITAGTNSGSDKAALIATAWQVLSDILGTVHEASYVVVQEIPAGDWGYGGVTQDARRRDRAALP